MGFSHRIEPLEGGAFAVRFAQTGVRASATVADVAERSPAAAEVFERHLMDLCCGGSLTLERAAQAHGVELGVLLAELREAAAR
jgi:iron-sulfur cluster repair protein YtfE (RIC family)